MGDYPWIWLVAAALGLVIGAVTIIPWIIASRDLYRHMKGRK